MLCIKKLKIRSSFIPVKFLNLQAEINYLGQLRHPNLVKLIGYCLEDDHRLLVYEFMSKGSMENHLFRSKSSMFDYKLNLDYF